MHRIARELRYRSLMRRARRAYRKAVDRGGRTWTRDALYERVRER